MKKVYTHENRLIVFNLKNLLEEQGIACVIKNEFSSGGVGELAPLETWPEIWISDDEQFDQAKQAIHQILNEESNGEGWFCSHCGEHNDCSFQICWNCQASRP